MALFTTQEWNDMFSSIRYYQYPLKYVKKISIHMMDGSKVNVTDSLEFISLINDYEFSKDIDGCSFYLNRPKLKKEIERSVRELTDSLKT